MTTAEKIKHLYWRAGFGLSPEEWIKVQNWSLEKVIDHLFIQTKLVQPLEVPNPFGELTDKQIQRMNPIKKKKLRELGEETIKEQNFAWIQRMVSPDESPLLERICVFWNGHFACNLKNPIFAARQLNTFREHGLGNFRSLVQAMAKDVAMIRYLNNQQNKKKTPNENFARELMELFTIGRGHYTEQDVKEAARAFTGWSSNLRGDFFFRTRQHDYGTKVFMNQRGDFNGDEIIDIILDQKATAVFICRKIYAYFVNEKIDEGIVRELAEDFYQSDYDLEKLFRKIFTSDWFYAPQHVGTKIKSPLDLVVGMMKSLSVAFDNKRTLLLTLKRLGQALFRPPNVAGWPGGKNWIDNSTLMTRLSLAKALYDAAEVSFNDKDLKAAAPRRKKQKLAASTDFQPILSMVQGQAQKIQFKELKKYLIQSPISHQQKDLEKFVLLNSEEEYIKSMTLCLMTLPEYQLC